MLKFVFVARDKNKNGREDWLLEGKSSYQPAGAENEEWAQTRLTWGQRSEKGKEHPVRGREKHPTLDIGQCLFTSVDSKPQQSRHQAET